METLQASHIEQISTITLNRPTVHNAFNAQMIHELQQAFAEAEQHPDTRVIWLTANGKQFCAGADLIWMQQAGKRSAAENQSDALQLARLFEQISNNSKPTLALVHGRVMGGGCGLVACCDIAIAATDSVFCFSETRLGLMPATIAPYIVRRMGYQQSKRYFLTTETMDTATALRTNLIDQQVAAEYLLSCAQELTEQLCRNGKQAMQQTKHQLNRLCPVERAIMIDSANQLALLRTSEEAQQRLQAFFRRKHD